VAGRPAPPTTTNDEGDPHHEPLLRSQASDGVIVTVRVTSYVRHRAECMMTKDKEIEGK
jgi:hypothetical protein